VPPSKPATTAKTVMAPKKQAIQTVAGAGATVAPPKKQQPKAKAEPKKQKQEDSWWPMGEGEWDGKAAEEFNQKAGEYLNKMTTDFALAAVDLRTTDEQLENIYQQLSAVRNPIGFFCAWQAGMGGNKGMAALTNGDDSLKLTAEGHKQRQEQLVRAVSKYLKENKMEQPLSAVISDPAIASIRKGAISNVAKLLREYPQHFEFKFVDNSKEDKKPIQMLRLIKAVPAGNLLKRKHEDTPLADLREALVQALADVLSDAGGSATISELGADSRVQTAKAPLKDEKLIKFLGTYPEVFSIDSEKESIPRASLLVAPTAAVATASVGAKLEADAAAKEVARAAKAIKTA